MSADNNVGRDPILNISKRDFLKISGVTGLGLIVALGLDTCSGWPGVNGPPTSLPSDKNLTPTPDLLQYNPHILTEREVLNVPVSKDKTVGDIFTTFEEDESLKNSFNDPSLIRYSAMGVSIGRKGQKDTVYPFLSAVSEEEQRGYTAIVMQVENKVGPVFLNRMVDAKGFVGMGIDEPTAKQLGVSPVIYISTGLTADQIAKMTTEELQKRDLIFVPDGIKITPDQFKGHIALTSYERQAVATTTPTVEPTATKAPEATNTPDHRNDFNVVTDPEKDSEINFINLKQIANGDAANWLLSQPESKGVISNDIRKIKYVVTTFYGDANFLSALYRDDKSGTIRNSKFISLLKIRPSEFGLKGEGDLYIVCSIAVDKFNNKVPEFGLIGNKNGLKHYIENGFFVRGDMGVVVRNKLTWFDDPFYIDGPANGAGDLRGIKKGEILLGKQRGGLSQKDVDVVFAKVAEMDGFSTDTGKFISTTLLPGGYNIFMNP